MGLFIVGKYEFTHLLDLDKFTEELLLDFVKSIFQSLVTCVFMILRSYQMRINISWLTFGGLYGDTIKNVTWELHVTSYAS